MNPTPSMLIAQAHLAMGFRLDAEFLVIPLSIIGLGLVYGHLRRRGTLDRWLNRPQYRPSLTARLIESVLLGSIGGLLIIVCGFNTHKGGYMGCLDLFQDDYTRVNVLMFVAALIGAAIATIIALLGRSAIATAMMAVVVLSYIGLIDSGEYPGQPFISKDRTRPITQLRFDLGDPSIHGAELWVNGVRLGTMPFAITKDDFLRKVPNWPAPPEADEAPQRTVTKWGLAGPCKYTQHPWGTMYLPTKELDPGMTYSKSWSSSNKNAGGDGEDLFFIRVKHGNEWSYSGIGAGPSFRTIRYPQINYTISVGFPERPRRLERLLDRARQADYRFNANWIAAADTYNQAAPDALRKAAETEPRMLDLLNTWATSRYALDMAVDSDSSWATFERICDDVDNDKYYAASSIAGHAVQMLAPRLDPNRLCNRAERLFKKSLGYRWTSWPQTGLLEFAYPHGTHFANMKRNQAALQKTRPSDFAVAHAIWLAHKSQRTERMRGETTIQRRIGPALVRQKEFEAATFIGGPQVVQFLNRQDWSSEPDYRANNVKSIRGVQINLWHYLRANLDDTAGVRFRQVQRHTIMNMTDKLISPFLDLGLWQENSAFLFKDMNLAQQYWPRFVHKVRGEIIRDPLSWQWDYLRRMEPHSTVEMYVDSWKQTPSQYWPHTKALSLLKNLPEDKRVAILDGVSDFLRENSDPAFSSAALRLVQDTLAQDHDLSPEFILQEIQKPNGRYRQEIVALWLQYTKPNSPLVAMLAEQKAPALRAMAIGPCLTHPTPEHRAILHSLTLDFDSEVRTKARQTLAELSDLAATNPMAFADPPR